MQDHEKIGRKEFIVAAPGATTPICVLPANGSRISATIANHGSQTVFLGGDPIKNAPGQTLGSTTGFPLLAGDTADDSVSTDSWWAIAASGTGDLRIIETRK